jgi:hypothetical protein
LPWVGIVAAVLLLTAGTASAQIQKLKKGAGAAHLSGKSQTAQFRNVTITPRSDTRATIQFDISWAGTWAWGSGPRQHPTSWRNDINHDAQWVFFKVRPHGGDKPWRHVRLAASKVLNPTGYGQGGGTPLEFLVPRSAKDGHVGVFLRQAMHGERNVKATKVTVVWDLTGSPGITKNTPVDLKAFAVNMTYVAEGPFSVGSGGDESGSFYMYDDGKNDRTPYRITKAGAIPTGKEKGKLWARTAQPEDGGEIPATFPNGFKAFYCMQRPFYGALYADFLNNLTPEQAKKHFMYPQKYGGYRTGGVKRSKKPPFIYSGDDGYPMKWISWSDARAYAAWAGLRPMTELELEKSIRGPRTPVPNEAGNSYWSINYGGGRYNQHPRERPITVANKTGRAFKGTHGTGSLYAVPADWPGEDAVGVGLRLGWVQWTIGYLGQAHFNTSMRLDAGRADTERSDVNGFRCVRTAPEEE